MTVIDGKALAAKMQAALAEKTAQLKATDAVFDDRNPFSVLKNLKG